MTPPHIDITWNPAKAEANLIKHGVTFSDVAEILMDPMALTVFDAVHSQTSLLSRRTEIASHVP